MKRLVVVNLLLGIPGIAYYWMLSVMILREPLTTWGRMLKDLFEANSLLPMQTVLGPPLAICTMVWVLTNVNLVDRRKRTGSCASTGSIFLHWVIALATSLIPALLVFCVASFF